MKRERNGNKQGTVNIVVSGIGRARPQRRRKKPGDRRGTNPEFAAQKFKPGNQFGARPRKQIPKFSDAYEVALLQEVPAALRKQLKLRKGTTMMELLVTRVVQEAVISASIPHVQELREVTQGKVANKNVNVTAELELYATNPAFQQFIAEKLAEFKEQQQLMSGE